MMTTKIPRVKLPKTPEGNDPDDWKDNPEAVEAAKAAVEAAAKRDRIIKGNLTRHELDHRIYFLDLCKEFTSRTGHPLCETDKRQIEKYTIDLKLAGEL
jgi:hypothetical protein